MRRIARAKIAERVQRAWRWCGSKHSPSADRRSSPAGSSSASRLARALVFEPSLVLMDEPLGALDKKLREQMQIEIKLLHERLGLTVVYVTHDQSEALTMSDRIAVFHDGQVMQQGTPDVLYSQPCDAFVAGFIGENNMLSGTVEAIANGMCASRSPVAFKCWPRPLGDWIVARMSLLLFAQRQCASPRDSRRGGKYLPRARDEPDLSRRPSAAADGNRRRPHGDA